MESFATTAELVVYMGGDGAAPEHATRHLRTASRLVLHAVRAARFPVDPDGVPRELRVRNALREATLEHATALVDAEIDPTRGVEQVAREVQSKSLSSGGASVTYGSRDAARAALAAGEELTPAASEILAAAGLLGGRVVAPARATVTPLVRTTGYDLLTGDLDG